MIFRGQIDRLVVRTHSNGVVTVTIEVVTRHMKDCGYSTVCFNNLEYVLPNAELSSDCFSLRVHHCKLFAFRFFFFLLLLFSQGSPSGSV